MRIIAISDIHGCLDSFKALLKTINYTKGDRLFLIGDFIDRGPDSKGVIDHIWKLQKEGFTLHCLKGNHEEMLLNSRNDSEKARFWNIHGGKTTLESFKATSIYDIPKEYISWMNNLPLFMEWENYIFVHAGLNFDIPNPLEGFHSMLWTRNWYEEVNYSWLKDRIIVHGHTPISQKGIREMFSKLDHLQVLDIDGGCAFERENLGYLCGVDLTSRELFFQRKIL